MKMLQHLTISSNTRIKTLLDVDSEAVIKELIELDQNFSRLKNPILRKLFANRITIADACKIVDCKVDDFFARMKRIGFLIDLATSAELMVKSPDGIDFTRHATVLEFDARPYLQENRDPLREIIAAVNKLQIGDRIRITNTFEPVPLISLLGDKGYGCHVEHVETSTVITWFEKNSEMSTASFLNEVEHLVDAPEIFETVLGRFKTENIRYIDVRELEMPKPMLVILENLETLRDGDLLFIHHKKVPVFLLPELHKKGVTFLLKQKRLDQVDMLIYRS